MYCQNCGNKIEGELGRCIKCGRSTTLTTTQEGAGPIYLPAKTWKRFVHYILDDIIAVILASIIANIVMQIVAIPEAIGGIFVYLLFFGYFIVFEYVWQRTPAKWITKTKVVRKDGERPRIGQVIGRTFARFIPFEPLSFLFSGYAMGWHDKLSGTLVVPSDYSAENVRNINFAEAKKSKVGAFVVVIIVFVVVLPLIGILASVVLASLNVARQKAQEVKNLEASQSLIDVPKTVETK